MEATKGEAAELKCRLAAERCLLNVQPVIHFDL